MARVSWMTMWVSMVAAAACGRSGEGISAAPQLSDACALHDTADACKADMQCEVRPNGVACPSGGTCLDFACVSQGAAAGAGAPGNPPSCACMMVDMSMSSGMDMGMGVNVPGVCVEQLGGPPAQAGAMPPLSCRSMCAAATAADVCGCIAQSAIEHCKPSPSVRNLCECDDGVR